MLRHVIQIIKVAVILTLVVQVSIYLMVNAYHVNIHANYAPALKHAHPVEIL